MANPTTAAVLQGKVGPASAGRRLDILLTGWPGFHLAWIIFGALLATAVGALGHEAIKNLLLALLTVVTGLRALLLASVRPLSKAAALIVCIVPFLVALSILVSGRVSGNHLYPVFLVAFIVTMELDKPIRMRTLLRLTNAYFLVYLGMSLLVYFGVVDLNRELNVFDATRRAPLLDFKTLVGFYGSTAHIDAISLFIALLNLLWGRGRRRYLMIAIAVAAGLASVRFTPFVALGVALLATGMIVGVRRARSARRSLAIAIGLAIVLSVPLSMVAVEVVPSQTFERAVNMATNGRLLIWQTMAGVFAGAPVLSQAFGTGSTEPYYLVGGWPRMHPTTMEVSPLWTANPHNSYLSLALTLGLAAFVVLMFSLAVLLARMRTWRALLVTFYVLTVGTTNAELLTFYFPIYVAWLLWMSRVPPPSNMRAALSGNQDMLRPILRDGCPCAS